MARYTSKPVEIARSADSLFDRISNIGSYQQILESLPEDERSKLGDVKFTDDAIIITAAPVGEMRFDVVERTRPERVVLSAAQSPVPLTMSVDLTPVDEEKTSVAARIDVEIPAMLKPMIGGKMQQAADMFGNLITTFFS